MKNLTTPLVENDQEFLNFQSDLNFVKVARNGGPLKL